jgi:hypothetical protein
MSPDYLPLFEDSQSLSSVHLQKLHTSDGKSAENGGYRSNEKMIRSSLTLSTPHPEGKVAFLWRKNKVISAITSNAIAIIEELQRKDADFPPY